MSYQGHERRRHRVYVTRNTEYHLRDGICIAVRDRQSKAWRPAHIALNRKLEGSVKIFSNGAVIPVTDGPGVGDAMYFNEPLSDGEERQIVTSRVERIERPPKYVVAEYPLAMSA